MPRMPRNPLEGGVYHVYNRFARGEEVFADPEAAQHFVEMTRHARRRDGFVLHAWCLMSNHYHLALKTSAVPLSRTMHALQGGFARWFNQRDRRTGPLWQSRYQARLVDDEQYFDELVMYVHLNPVRAGLVGDPGDYQLCGHGELLGRAKEPLVDVDEDPPRLRRQRPCRPSRLRPAARGCARERKWLTDPGEAAVVGAVTACSRWGGPPPCRHLRAQHGSGARPPGCRVLHRSRLSRPRHRPTGAPQPEEGPCHHAVAGAGGGSRDRTMGATRRGAGSGTREAPRRGQPLGADGRPASSRGTVPRSAA